MNQDLVRCRVREGRGTTVGGGTGTCAVGNFCRLQAIFLSREAEMPRNYTANIGTALVLRVNPVCRRGARTAARTVRVRMRERTTLPLLSSNVSN